MRPRVSSGTAIALGALFLSLGGAGWAATRYLITSTKQIKPSVLRQLAGHAGPQGRQGSAGPAGLIGPVGPTGPMGASGAVGGFSTANISTVNGPTVTAAPGKVNGSLAICPIGTVVVGGGFAGTDTPPVQATVSDDDPLQGISWDVVIAHNSATEAPGFYAVAICAASSSSHVARARDESQLRAEAARRITEATNAH